MTAAQIGLLKMMGASLAVMVLCWALAELLRPEPEIRHAVADPVPPWMAAQLQDEATAITRDAAL